VDSGENFAVIESILLAMNVKIPLSHQVILLLNLLFCSGDLMNIQFQSSASMLDQGTDRLPVKSVVILATHLDQVVSSE